MIVVYLYLFCHIIGMLILRLRYRSWWLIGEMYLSISMIAAFLALAQPESQVVGQSFLRGLFDSTLVPRIIVHICVDIYSVNKNVPTSKIYVLSLWRFVKDNLTYENE